MVAHLFLCYERRFSVQKAWLMAPDELGDAKCIIDLESDGSSTVARANTVMIV